MNPDMLTVGELAKRSGLTIRTLHHYDEVGLLRPSNRSEAGYRLYANPDVARLQQILSLKQLGLSLDDIGRVLTQSGLGQLEVIRLHADRLAETIDSEQRLLQQLEVLVEHLGAGATISSDEFLASVELMVKIQERCSAEEWSDLFAAVNTAIDTGVDPCDPQAQALARRWEFLMNRLAADDAEALRTIRDTITNTVGADAEPLQRMLAYIEQSSASAGDPQGRSSLAGGGNSAA